ncbi:MAG: LysM peptidoglycan-binding domain-containing protein [Pseudonocardiaceae bacterium]
MTAPAQLGGWPAAGREKIVSNDVGPVRLAVSTRPLPAPPAPVPPRVAPVRGRRLACRVLAPALGGAQAAHPSAVRSSRVIRVVAAATVTLAVVGGLGWIGQGWIGQGASPGVPAETAVVRVGAGETVWDVARRVAPQSDQRAVVERIRQLNAIVGSAITPGQQLQVPLGR